jgi:2-dehydro-3-deoxyphosphooctonate aldolase (KDO 8-P synthase)
MPIVSKEIPIAEGVVLGGRRPQALIAGPCVIESEDHALALAGSIKDICARLKMPFIFKASYDKANRTSGKSFRGPGLKEGLAVLQRVKETHGVPVLSDVHETGQVDPAAEVLDVIQIPALLIRQTDLVVRAARTGKPLNLKKGQFMAPEDMKHVLDKVLDQGNDKAILTERGACFGYHNLVFDVRSIPIMKKLGCPVASMPPTAFNGREVRAIAPAATLNSFPPWPRPERPPAPTRFSSKSTIIPTGPFRMEGTH